MDSRNFVVSIDLAVSPFPVLLAFYSVSRVRINPRREDKESAVCIEREKKNTRETRGWGEERE